MVDKKVEKPSVARDIMYGIINSIMCLPVMISFTSIIFRDPAFAIYLPKLVKLVLFSSMIHQIAFTLFSGFPFAVGQVQDAGLIFLSSMADSVVQLTNNNNNNSKIDANDDINEMMIPTTLAVLAIATALLGGMLMLMGYLKLASIVQYLPMPVIGGYLAFIGFFCGEAGLSMMSGTEVTHISQWGRFLTIDAIQLMTPGVVAGILVSYLLRTVNSPYVLPIFMLLFLTIFFIVMNFYNMSLEDARNFGWIAPLEACEPFYESWSLYDPYLVDWSVFPSQIFKLIGLFLIVSFSSSLDVAAIEMECGRPLNYDHELTTVGISNLCSGMTGGFSGSYIFSQTIFSFRRGITSRWSGWVIVIAELFVILLPIPVTSYLPKAFFGSLLILIACELMMEWLIHSRSKMTDAEYSVCIITFLSIIFLGVEIGMLAGVLVAMFIFVCTYAYLMSEIEVSSSKSSTVVRTYEEQLVLINHRHQIVTVSLSGYIFFGSAVRILNAVKTRVKSKNNINNENKNHINNSNNNNNNNNNNSSSSSSSSDKSHEYTNDDDGEDRSCNFKENNNNSSGSRRRSSSNNIVPTFTAATVDKGVETGIATERTLLLSKQQQQEQQQQKEENNDNEVDENGDDNNNIHETFYDTEYLILDFTRVEGVDATAARSCFLMLQQTMKTRGVTVIFAAMNKNVEKILRAQQVVTDDDVMLPHHDDSLEFCEESILSKTYYLKSKLKRNRTYYDDAWRARYEQALIAVNSTNTHADTDNNNYNNTYFDGDKGFYQSIGDFESRDNRDLKDMDIYVALESATTASLDDKKVSPVRGTNRSPYPKRLRPQQRQKSDAHISSINTNNSSDFYEFDYKSKSQHSTPSGSPVLGAGAGAGKLRMNKTGRNAVNDESESDRVKSRSPALDLDEAYLASQQASNTGISGVGIGTSFTDTTTSLIRNSGDAGADNGAGTDFILARADSVKLICIIEDYIGVNSIGSSTNDLTIQSLTPENVMPFFIRKEYRRLQMIYEKGFLPDHVYFIETGIVETVVYSGPVENPKVDRVNKFTAGGVFGMDSFLLNSPYSNRAIAVSEGVTVVWSLSKASFAKMEVNNPKLCILIQKVLLKATAMTMKVSI